MAKSMRPHEVVRFYIGCPRCGAKPGQRCVSIADGFSWARSNHPARNERYREIGDEIRAGSHPTPEEDR